MSLSWINPYYLLVSSFLLINVLLGVSIYITLSTGQLSLGNAGFMSIGAYTTAILTTRHGIPMPAGIAAGTLLAAITGILVGIPALRLKGVYLAIATLGFGEVVRVLFVNWEKLTGGAVGIAAIPQMGRRILSIFRDTGFSPEDWGLRSNQFISLTVFFLLLAVTVLVILFFLRLGSGRVGRAYSAIRMDEPAAEASGINTTYYKVLAFTQGAALSGFAGALFAHVTSYISPADFTYHRAVEILVFAIFGGSEHLLGPVFGAMFLTAVPELLRPVSGYRNILYGIVLILVIIFRPQGWIDPPLIRRLRGGRTPESR
ncbi:MAG TPA: branched-chain amino acid ABC transporter permease [Candidatus Deferrimicrobiaceae bacterium]|nr:branched-chain amino acid ABC transporter permease [Candidatus Deferrimicrobiaceae bacterium]